MFGKFKKTLALSPAQNAPTPHYRLITDGLIITDSRAQAWFELPISSTQLASEDVLDREILLAIASAKRALKDLDCQLRILWSLTESTEYVNTADKYTTQQAAAWARARANAIDSWALPKRHVLLGVDIENRTDPFVVRSINTAAEWIGGDRLAIPAKELAYLTNVMHGIRARLNAGVLKAELASAETLAWMVGRELHRSIRATPKQGLITGAGLAMLASGRAVPWRDHIRFYAETGHEVAHSALLAITDFPETIDSGDGGWLLALSGIDRPDLSDGTYDVPVLAEASIRFTIHSRPDALKRIERARRSAKEQRIEASKGSAGETSRDIELSEAELHELAALIKRGQADLVSSWPVLTVTEESLAELDASVDAVIDHYAGMGITVERLADQQMEAWLSTLPCDQVRIEDYYHLQETPAFFASLFWTGSVVGEDDGHVIGYTTGATKTLVRYHPTEHPLRGDSATSLVVGRSGRGKTTALQLFALDAAAEGAWVPVVDYKGDLNNVHGGLVSAAHSVGINATRIDLGSQYGGTCDLFALMDEEDALIQAHSQLMLLISEHLRIVAHPLLMDALNARIKSGKERTTSALIDDLLAHPDPDARKVGGELAAFKQDSLANLIVGQASSATPLITSPGICLIQVPKMDLPDAATPYEQWTLSNRVSMAVARGILAWLTTGARKDELRPLRKLVVIPEAHLFTANAESANFLVRISRMGRAYGVHLLLDTQDPASVAKYEGITEQITTLFAFSLNTADQQDATARLLGQAPSEYTRAAIQAVSVGADGRVWHGHAYMRDVRGRVAAVQIAIPNPAIARALSTTPEAHAVGDIK